MATATNEDTMETITARYTVKYITRSVSSMRDVELEYVGFDGQISDDLDDPTADAKYEELDRLYAGFSFDRNPVLSTELPLEPGQVVELSLRVIGTA